MKNQTKTLNRLLLSKVKIATVSEQRMVSGGDRSKRGTNSKTGDTRQQIVGQFQVQPGAVEIVFM